jgi:hypothetical protein
MALPVVTSRLLALLHAPRREHLVALEGERIGESLERTYWQTLRDVLPLMQGGAAAPKRRRRRGAA